MTRDSRPAARPHHLVEYAIEAAGLALFMMVASACATALEHPSSPLRIAMPDPLMRRVIMGLAMGTTAVAIIYSRWGMRSGAHLNPAVTLAFATLGRVGRRDAVGYVIGQIVGATSGLLAAAALIGPPLGHPAIAWMATVPGPSKTAAVAAEFAMTFVLMATVLVTSSRPRLSRYTGLFAGALVALYIALEAPISGMSLNPARSLAPAVLAQRTDVLWIYVTAPVAGMLSAALLARFGTIRFTACAKLHHGHGPCIFCHRPAPEPGTRAAFAATEVHT